MTLYNPTEDFIDVVTKRFGFIIGPRDMMPVDEMKITKKDIALFKRKGIRIVQGKNLTSKGDTK